VTPLSAMELSLQAQHFDLIDRRLFARLYSGGPGPLKVSLKDGRQMVGEIKAVARRRQRDTGGTQMTGTILLMTVRGEFELDYATIADID
jgi:hypothetical protein